MADRIGIIHHGKLLTEGTFDQLRAHSGRQNATLEDLFLNLIETADAA
jgi:ABC-type multidrug transport system ATPase subunit